jgi:dCMP deaminase
MKEKFKIAYMNVAQTFAQLSTAKRAQVGAIIVKDDRIISIGYNGMPSGWDNDCEDLLLPDWAKSVDDIAPADRDTYVHYKTKPEVLHAEANAITKVAQSSDSSKNAVLFCTHMPCIECAKLIHQSGISEVFYKQDYTAAKGSGEKFLQQSNIKLEKV